MNPKSSPRFSITRMIARFFIDRSVDTGQAPPAWVSALCQRDAELADYERRARGLVDQLRTHADAWASSPSKVRELRTPMNNATSAPSAAAIRPKLQLASHGRAWRLLATAALLALAIGAWIAWGRQGESESNPRLVQQNQSETLGPNADAMVGVDRDRSKVQSDRDDRLQDARPQDEIVDWKPVLASAAATEEVFRRVSNGTWQMLNRTLALSTELGVDLPRARAEEAGKGLRERGVQLRQSVNGMSEAFSRFLAAGKQPQ